MSLEKINALQALNVSLITEARGLREQVAAYTALLASLPNEIKDVASARKVIAAHRIEIVSLKSQNDAQAQQIERGKVLRDQLKKICMLKGLDPEFAAPNLDMPEQYGQDDTEAVLSRDYKNAKTPEEKKQVEDRILAFAERQKKQH